MPSFLRKKLLTKLDPYTAKMSALFLILMTLLLATSIVYLFIHGFILHETIRVGAVIALIACSISVGLLLLGHYHLSVRVTLLLFTLTPLFNFIFHKTMGSNSLFFILLILFYAVFTNFWLTVASFIYLILYQLAAYFIYHSNTLPSLFSNENAAFLSIAFWIIGLAYYQNQIRLENARLDVEKKQLAEMLLMQSRSITLGETIGNVGHQWRQPLNNLGLILQGLKNYSDKGQLTGEKVEKYYGHGMSMVQFLDSTLEDYLSFFKQCQEKVDYSLSSAVLKALSLLEYSLKKCDITVSSTVIEDSIVHGCVNDLVHIILNLVNNAKDIHLERKTVKPAIFITICLESGLKKITVSDNAGGIDARPIEKIFQPFFTTRTTGNGIGLYLVKKIVESRLQGTITALNATEGAEFVVKIP